MNDITLLTLTSVLLTFIIVLTKICFKSKCNEINCYGIKIKRNV